MTAPRRAGLSTARPQRTENPDPSRRQHNRKPADVRPYRRLRVLHAAHKATTQRDERGRHDAAPAGLRERFLPECTFRGRQCKKLRYAVLAAAALHDGADPDLLDEVTWWQTDDFWQSALFATVAYIRAAASRAGMPVSQACQDLAHRPSHPSP